MRREKERVERKALKGLTLVEEGRLWDAERAFKSAGVASGLALVAYHQGRYERAANKATSDSCAAVTRPRGRPRTGRKGPAAGPVHSDV